MLKNFFHPSNIRTHLSGTTGQVAFAITDTRQIFMEEQINTS